MGVGFGCCGWDGGGDIFGVCGAGCGAGCGAAFGGGGDPCAAAGCVAIFGG